MSVGPSCLGVWIRTAKGGISRRSALVNWHVYGFTDLDGTSPVIWQHMENAEKN
jgi:hypothetical protein